MVKFTNVIEKSIGRIEIRQAVQAFKVGVQAFKTDVQAFRVDVQAFKADVQAFRVGVQAFKAGIQAFKVDVQAFKAGVQAFREPQIRVCPEFAVNPTFGSVAFRPQFIRGRAMQPSDSQKLQILKSLYGVKPLDS